MKKGHMPASHVSHPNVTPLIDIVMCLIIFYMLVAKIGVDTGIDAKMTLPVSLQGIKLKDLGNTVNLNISPAPDPQAVYPSQGSLPVVSVLVPGKGLTPLPLLDAKDPTKHPLQAWLKSIRGDNKEFKVIIRADQDLPYKYLEPVLIECAVVKVANVNFATRDEPAIKQLKVQ